MFAYGAKKTLNQRNICIVTRIHFASSLAFIVHYYSPSCTIADSKSPKTSKSVIKRAKSHVNSRKCTV